MEGKIKALGLMLKSVLRLVWFQGMCKDSIIFNHVSNKTYPIRNHLDFDSGGNNLNMHVIYVA